QPPLPIPEFLLLAVLLGSRGVLLAVLFPITGMAGAPFTRTIPAHLAVLRIGGDLLSVVIGAALSLASGSAADRLAGLELRWLENLLAVTTAPFTHTGVVASGSQRFRNCCRVRTASPPMAQPQNRRICGRFSPAMTCSSAPSIPLAESFTCFCANRHPEPATSPTNSPDGAEFLKRYSG